MSHFNVNAPKAGTDTLGAARGTRRLQTEELEKLVATLPVADAVTLAGGAEDSETAARVAQFSAREQVTLKDLPQSVLKQLFADAPDNVEGARLAMANKLLGMTKGLVPGAGVSFDPPKAWRLSDAAIAYKVVAGLSPVERQRIEGVEFKRVKSTLLADTQRESDGKAVVSIDQGVATAAVGTLHKLGFKLASFFERFAMTGAIGRMLHNWFPHPAIKAEITREILIGDAQAQRMKETLTHEIGHQVQFGPEINLSAIKEWAKLSGWKNADGTPANGLGKDGNLIEFDPSVKPTRKDNFVYEDFTADLTPDKLRLALSEITDPELRAEFMTTAKVQKNLRGTINEVFGIDAKGYSMTSPLEDFAESFRAFHMDTELLVRKAPDKFLFLNATSARYSPEQVKTFFERSGKNPQTVATALLQNSDLTQETVDRIFKANGLKGDVGALGVAAAKELGDGKAVDPFREAFMLVQKKVADKDLGFLGAFTQDAAKALGDHWGKLSPAQQKQFGTVEQRQKMVHGMQAGLMSAASIVSQGHNEIQEGALLELAALLLKNPSGPWRIAPALARNLPTTVQTMVANPANRAKLEAFMQEVTRLNGGGGQDDDKVAALISKMDPEAVKAAMDLVKTDPKKAAEVLANWIQGDPNGPPQ